MSTYFQTTCTRVQNDGKVHHFTEGYHKPTTDLDYIRHDPAEIVHCEGGTDAEYEAACHLLDDWDGESPVSIIVHHNDGCDIMAWFPVPAPKPSLLDRFASWLDSLDSKVEVSS